MDGSAVPAPTLKPHDYKSDINPVWCPGCGHFGVQAALLRAFSELRLNPAEVVVVSGIGCSSRLPAYLTAYGFHGLHGRALPLATGIKLARPELTVVAVGGDGDGFSIGGNHFLHACRRNVDLTYIVMDNEVYGMTKGQPSPTTPPEWDESDLAPGGTGIGAFRPLGLALSSGANFIARCYAGDPNGTARIFAEAIRSPGFAFVHVLSQCVTYRPDEVEWRRRVHPAEAEATADFQEAARRAAADDGLTLGVMYAGTRAPYQPPIGAAAGSLADLEREFIL